MIFVNEPYDIDSSFLLHIYICILNYKYIYIYIFLLQDGFPCSSFLDSTAGLLGAPSSVYSVICSIYYYMNWDCCGVPHNFRLPHTWTRIASQKLGSGHGRDQRQPDCRGHGQGGQL